MNANRKKVIIVLAAAVLMGAAAAGPLLGQPQNRARLRDNINTLRLLRMTQALELTEDQTVRLFPALTRIDREKSELQNRMSMVIRDLRAALDRTPAREAEILALVQQVRDLRESVRRKDAEFDAALDVNLTPVQKGRYLIFLVDFAKGLGEKLNQARQARLGR